MAKYEENTWLICILQNSDSYTVVIPTSIQDAAVHWAIPQIQHTNKEKSVFFDTF